jgi:hypothetical protein
VFFAPDVQAMDLSLHRVHTDVLHLIFRTIYPEAPTEVHVLMSVYFPLMVSAPILLESLIISAKGGLRSGASMTTLLDCVASLMVYTLYQKKKKDGEYFEDLAPALAKELGLVYKKTTLKVHRFRDGDKALGVPFLGVQVVYVDTPYGSGWIPKRADEDTAKSLVAPRIVSSEDKTGGVELGRLVSLYMWGSWAMDEKDELKSLIRSYSHEIRGNPVITSESPWLKLPPSLASFPDDGWFASLIWSEEDDPPEVLPVVEVEEDEETPAAFTWADESENAEAKALQTNWLKLKHEDSQGGIIADKKAEKEDASGLADALPKKAVKPKPFWARRK